MPDPSPPALIVLFDGDCGLCNAAVHFILKRDPHRRFRFAPLQSQVARDLLACHQINPDDLSSVVLIEQNRVYLRSNAALRIALELPEPWPLLGIASFIPAFLRDDLYDFIARHRKQWFKSPDTCPAPTAEEREQFLA